MRAVAHRVRVALLEALGKYKLLTATEAAEVVDESPSTCSFHLRQLAKYGFIEEAGGGTGRQRPWRLTQMGRLLPWVGGSIPDPARSMARGPHGVATRVARDHRPQRVPAVHHG